MEVERIFEFADVAMLAGALAGIIVIAFGWWGEGEE